MLVQELLKKGAEKYGDKTFAVCGEKQISYRELAYYSDILALKLQMYGKGLTMGVLAKNSLEYLLCYFAVIKSGNIFVAINPLNRKNDLQKIMKDAGIRVLFAGSQQLKTVLEMDEELLQKLELYSLDNSEEEFIDKNGLRIKSFQQEAYIGDVAESDKEMFYMQEDSEIAQIIYTSGTKGFPNGVCLTHQNLIANMEQIKDRIDITEQDNMLVILAFYYSYGNSLILSHLASGAKLTINNNSQLPVFILKDLTEKECTSVAGVATNFIMMLKRSKFKEMELPHLRYLTFAGEPVADWVITELKSMGLDIYVMYGQTEATARISILKPKELAEKPSSVGRPIKGVDLKIIDAEGNVLPPGEYGQVIVSGPNIMKGYWNDPESTAGKIKDSYLYTGDFGMLDEDGYLYISGRMDEMIKIGGERVFPIEIEKTLLAHELVDEAGVLGVKEVSDGESFSDYMGQTIYAFVVPKEGLTKNELFVFCKENLPPHKVPGRIVFVENLPRTNTGKLKRREMIKFVQ